MDNKDDVKLRKGSWSRGKRIGVGAGAIRHVFGMENMCFKTVGIKGY